MWTKIGEKMTNFNNYEKSFENYYEKSLGCKKMIKEDKTKEINNNFRKHVKNHKNYQLFSEDIVYL